MDMVCSSMGMEAVISWVVWETLTVRGWSAASWEGAQALTVASSLAIIRGESYILSDVLKDTEATQETHVFLRPRLDR